MINLSKTICLITLLIVFIIITGLFAYQWWQVKGELAKQIDENVNLIKKIDDLQRELEQLRVPEEKIPDETSGWKTYRNEIYGFKIDYPAVGWKIEEGYLRGALPFYFNLYKSDLLHFYIKGRIWFMAPLCENLSWKEIINNIYKCTEEQIYGMSLEKEITTNAKVKGYQVKLMNARGEMKGGFFPISGVKWETGEEALRACILFTYYLKPEPDLEEIKVFDHVISSFRFIKK